MHYEIENPVNQVDEIADAISSLARKKGLADLSDDELRRLRLIERGVATKEDFE